jgi:hypothetical protein
MRRAALLLAILLPAHAGQPSEQIGTIDFYGLGTLDAASLLKMLPFHEGGPIPSYRRRDRIALNIGKKTGRLAALSVVCCLPDGRSSVFVGLAEEGAPAIRYNPEPTGERKLPPDALAIFQQFDQHFPAAVKRGMANEDDSQGYALFADPACRADQLKLRDWARANTGIVLAVLTESRDSRQRAYAAEALGYADRSTQQIAALVTAAFDSNDGVRNNATRALGVLCTLGPEVTRQIPAERFIPLLHSLSWTDRNKALMLFDKITASPDPALLKMLHDQALVPLREMSRWKAEHAQMAIMLLDRMKAVSVQDRLKPVPRGPR